MKALVTGGRSGIGAALVERLEREGVEVRVLDISDGFDVSNATAWESVGRAIQPGSAIVDTPILADTRDQVIAAGIDMLRPEEVAEAILMAARDGSTGQAWVCLPAARRSGTLFTGSSRPPSLWL